MCLQYPPAPNPAKQALEPMGSAYCGDRQISPDIYGDNLLKTLKKIFLSASRDSLDIPRLPSGIVVRGFDGRHRCLPIFMRLYEKRRRRWESFQNRLFCVWEDKKEKYVLNRRDEMTTKNSIIIILLINKFPNFIADRMYLFVFSLNTHSTLEVIQILRVGEPLSCSSGTRGKNQKEQIHLRWWNWDNNQVSVD